MFGWSITSCPRRGRELGHDAEGRGHLEQTVVPEQSTIAVVLLRRHGPARAWSRHGVALVLTTVLAGTLVGVGSADLPVVGAFSHLGAHHTEHTEIPQG